jgi:hypothetical protein
MTAKTRAQLLRHERERIRLALLWYSQTPAPPMIKPEDFVRFDRELDYLGFVYHVLGGPKPPSCSLSSWEANTRGGEVSCL